MIRSSKSGGRYGDITQPVDSAQQTRTWALRTHSSRQCSVLTTSYIIFIYLICYTTPELSKGGVIGSVGCM